MKNIKTHEEMARQKYIAAEAPALLGQIVNGALAGGKEIDAKACAALAIKAAGELFDQLCVTVG